MGRGPNAGGGRHARGAKQQRSGGRGRGGRGSGRGVGRGSGRGGRGGSGRGGRGRGGRGGGKKKGKAPDWTCPSCGVVVFGSKSACFKCGTAKGNGNRAGGSSKDNSAGAAAPSVAVVDTVSISKADRALIRGLMDESSAQHLPAVSSAGSSPGGATPEGLKDRGGAVSRQLQAELAKMGFAEQDINKADDVCGGLRSIHGALNWLLLHTPEERIPPNLGSLPAPKRRGGRRSVGGGGGGAGAGTQKKDRSKMSDAQKVADNLIQIGFEPEDVEYCVQHTRKQTVYPDSLKMLFEWYKIKWNFSIDFEEGIPTSQIKAAASAERKALETKYVPL